MCIYTNCPYDVQMTCFIDLISYAQIHAFFTAFSRQIYYSNFESADVS